MGGLDQHLTDVVKAAVDEALAPYLRRLTDPECLTYSIPQAAKVLGVSDHMVRRAVDDGHLPTVPHMGERRLIPRRAVEELVNRAGAPTSLHRRAS